MQTDSDPNETPQTGPQPNPEELSKPQSSQKEHSDQDSETPEQVSNGGTGDVTPAPAAEANEEGNNPLVSGAADLVAEQIINEPEYPVNNTAQQFQQADPEDMKLTTHRIFPFTKVKACQRARLEIEPSDRPLLQ